MIARKEFAVLRETLVVIGSELGGRRLRPCPIVLRATCKREAHDGANQQSLQGWRRTGCHRSPPWARSARILFIAGDGPPNPYTTRQRACPARQRANERVQRGQAMRGSDRADGPREVRSVRGFPKVKYTASTTASCAPLLVS